MKRKFDEPEHTFNFLASPQMDQSVVASNLTWCRNNNDLRCFTPAVPTERCTLCTIIKHEPPSPSPSPLLMMIDIKLFVHSTMLAYLYPSVHGQFYLMLLLQKTDWPKSLVGAVRRQHQPLLLLQCHHTDHRLATAGKFGNHPAGETSGWKTFDSIDWLIE